MAEAAYASFEGNACRYTDSEAWMCFDGEWQQLNIAEAAMTARPMSKADYERAFPDVPAMPKAAFQSGG